MSSEPMSEYFTLAVSLALAVPYGYLIIAIIVHQPRQSATYVTVAGLILLWPTCIFVSGLQIIPIAAMSVWWWTGDFSIQAAHQPLRFRGRPPVGMTWMFVLTGVATVASGAYAYLLWNLERSTQV